MWIKKLFMLSFLALISIECTKSDSDDVDATGETDDDNGNANTASVVEATSAFLTTLSSTEKAAANIELNASNGVSWSNIPVGAATRNGVMLENLSTAQKTAALAVAAAALNTSGYKLFTDLQAADKKLGETKADTWGQDKYYIAVLGTPSTSTPWMLQLGGHHIAFNITYNGTVSGTPLFVGVEPLKWTASSVTYTPLETQRAAVDALAQTLVGNTTATLAGSFSDVVKGPSGTGAHDTNYPQSYPTTGRGVAVSALTADQKALVKTAIESWVNLLPSAVATPLLAEYESDESMAATYVGLGLNASNTVDFGANPSGLSSERSYLRIDGPRVWIEFVVQQGAADKANVHYHTLWRDKVADYGAEF